MCEKTTASKNTVPPDYGERRCCSAPHNWEEQVLPIMGRTRDLVFLSDDPHVVYSQNEFNFFFPEQRVDALLLVGKMISCTIEFFEMHQVFRSFFESAVISSHTLTNPCS